METVFTDSVTIGERHRQIDNSKVKSLAESMGAIGLMNPIHVFSSDNETVELVAGRHRLAAAQSLGWEQIDAVFVSLDEIDRELWEIDENLMRAELTPAQEAEHLKRRKELWEMRESGTNSSTLTGRGNKAFAQDTADKTGAVKQVINRKVRRAEKIDPQALNDLKGTSLDKGVELDALATRPAQEQRELAAKAKTGAIVTARKPINPPEELLTDDEIINRDLGRLMRAWEFSHPEARERFLEMVT